MYYFIFLIQLLVKIVNCSNFSRIIQRPTILSLLEKKIRLLFEYTSMGAGTGLVQTAEKLR